MTEKKLYKVLIADDEYWAREKIRTMVEWKDYQLQCLAPAVDGEDVLNKIEKEEPDILITDINMPFINGVELVKRLREKYPRIVTFIVSGYDDFGYVRDTLTSGAINYLMKPVNKIDLVQALSKALEIISDRQEKEKVKEEEALHLLKASSLIQDREFSYLVEQEKASFASSITINQNMDLSGYSLLLLKFHNIGELSKLYNYDMSYLSYSIKKELKALIEEEKGIIFNYVYRSNEYIIISELDNKELKEKAEKISVKLSGMSESLVSIIISKHFYSLESIHSAYIQAIATLMTRPFRHQSIVLVQAQSKVSEPVDVKNSITDEMENRIKVCLKNGNWSQVKRLIFEEIGLRDCETMQWGYLEVKQAVKKIFNLLLDFGSDSKSSVDILNLEHLGELADKTIETLDSERICNVIEEGIDYVSGLKREEESDSIRGCVKQIINYIDKNYFEEVNLNKLSREFGVEYSYLSKMFRQMTGENLILYLSRKRIEKAVELMRSRDSNLTEIAFMVGYDDYTYFSRVFKKKMGRSPREFKNSLEAKENRK